MTYYTGSIAAVPTANRHKYIEHASAAWPMFHSKGATRMVETWGVDVPKGKVTDFHRAVEAAADETVAFSWITWPDQPTADAAWQKIQSDPSMPQMPFDGKRMIFGGFAPVFEQGADTGAGYYQGFVLAVPEGHQLRYIEMAGKGWQMFSKRGALGMVENWGKDVPRGNQTDFYRATKLEEGEVPMFSWIAWPDRASCDAAATTMEADMADIDMSDMPFDGMRMMWGGFEPVFDSAAK